MGNGACSGVYENEQGVQSRSLKLPGSNLDHSTPLGYSVVGPGLKPKLVIPEPAHIASAALEAGSRESLHL